MTDAVLITGGFGYVGGRIARDLVGSGPGKVRIGSRRDPGARPDWARGLEVARMDFSDLDSLVRACDGITTVIHMATPNEIVCGHDPVLAIEATVMGTLRLILAAQASGVRRFVFFSTAHVYGAPLQGAIDETRLPRPVHPYAIAHKAAEDLVLAERDAGRLDAVVLRLSNGIGTPADAGIDRWTLVGNDLCRQFASEGMLTLQSSGTAVRDFIPLSDVVAAVRHILSLPADALRDGLFNLGGGKPALSIYMVAERIAARAEALFGIRPPIRRPEPQPDEKTVDLDFRIDRLRALGFSPAFDLDAEIDATLALCRDHFANPTMYP